MKVSDLSLYRSGTRFPMSYVFPPCGSRSRELRTSISEKQMTASASTKTSRSFTIGCWCLGGKKAAVWKTYYLLWQQGMITANTRNRSLPNNCLFDADQAFYDPALSVPLKPPLRMLIFF